MYSVLPSFVLGFHGCDQSVVDSVLLDGTRLKSHDNAYDWLGHGIYFWENNHSRALEFAQAVKKNPAMSKGKINKPAVIGAVINLGHCLNLLDSKDLAIVKKSYNLLRDIVKKDPTVQLPENKSIGSGKFLTLRYLDCAVIQVAHLLQDKLVGERKATYKFDSVRGLFVEGRELYKGAGFSDKNHIQICVRNPNCIKGYFRVLEPEESYNIP